MLKVCPPRRASLVMSPTVIDENGSNFASSARRRSTEPKAGVWPLIYTTCPSIASSSNTTSRSA